MSANMLGEALRTVCGPLSNLNQKLSGSNGEEWLAALKRFLRKENPWDGDKSTSPVWKTITLGNYKTVKDLRKCLERQKVCLGNWASDLLGQPGFTLSAERIDIDLVVLSVGDLGFPEGATYGEICDKAKKLELNLCPAEVGPALRYQYADQPHGEWLTIAMEPIADSDGDPDVFRVGRDDDDRWLGARVGFPERFWDPGFRFVFVSPSTRA